MDVQKSSNYDDFKLRYTGSGGSTRYFSPGKFPELLNYGISILSTIEVLSNYCVLQTMV